MLRVLLDTNIVIFVIRQRPLQALATFNVHAGRMAVSAITLAELLHGAEKCSRPTENLAVVEDFCSRLDVMPYGPKAAMYHGQIRAALERQGTPIGVNGLHIAAHARSEGLVLVTKTTASSTAFRRCRWRTGPGSWRLKGAGVGASGDFAALRRSR